MQPELPIINLWNGQRVAIRRAKSYRSSVLVGLSMGIGYAPESFCGAILYPLLKFEPLEFIKGLIVWPIIIIVVILGGFFGRLDLLEDGELVTPAINSKD